MKIFILLFFILNSSVVYSTQFDKYQSSIYESFNDSFFVEIINTDAEKVMFLVCEQTTEVNPINKAFKEYLFLNGILYNQFNNYNSNCLLLTLNNISLYALLDFMTGKEVFKRINKDLQPIYAYKIAGSINQQKILGRLSRQWDSYKANVSNIESGKWLSRNLKKDSLAITEISDKNRAGQALASLMYCYDKVNLEMKFYFSSNKIHCLLKKKVRNQLPTDGEVANFKAELENLITLDISNLSTWMKYIQRFDGQTSVNDALDFYRKIPLVSIEKVMLDYEEILASQNSKTNLNQDTVSKTAQALPQNYVINTFLESNEEQVIRLVISFENLSKNLCQTINCNLEYKPSFFIYEAGEPQALYFNFTAKHKVNDIAWIHKMVLLPLIKAQSQTNQELKISQENINVYAKGNIDDQDLMPLYKSLSLLPKQKISDLNSLNLQWQFINSEQESININVLSAEIGQMGWAELELAKYWLSYLHETQFANVDDNKEESAVKSTAYPLIQNMLLQDNLASLDIALSSVEESSSENFIEGINELLLLFKKDVTHENFNLIKGAFLKRIQLIDDRDFRNIYKSRYFNLPNLRDALLEMTRELSYKQFKYYLEMFLVEGNYRYTIYSPRKKYWMDRLNKG